ncbi:MAG: type II secretion system F family protein [Kiritimatiellae bacterium]|nr:type II secretion system F family protein [Kiritimatiellia bacterium]
MTSFRATVQTTDGKRQTILHDAESSAALVEELRAQGLLVLSCKPVKGSGAGNHFHPANLLPMTSLDVELGFRQLASMIRSGVSLLTALQTVQEQSGSPRAMRVWGRVHADVLGGQSLAESLKAQKGKFGEMAHRLIHVGEQSGELELALTRAADQMETRRNLRMLLVNALVYPILAVLMAIGVSVYLVMVVIPKISEFLQAGGSELPPMAQFLITLSDWMTVNYPWILAGIGSAIAFWYLLRIFSTGREAEDAFLLRIPVTGRILRLSGTALFARTMQMLTESGVTLLESLDVASQLLTNRRLSRRIRNAFHAVMRGETLAASLAAAKEFLPMLSRMAAVGETTGALAETFGETARFHEMLLSIAIKRFGIVIEPLMIVITGLIVGFVYIAFFTALFSMAGTN